MASIIKVDTIQTAAGGTPTAGDLGLNTTGSVLQVKSFTKTDTFSTTSSSFTDVTDLSLTLTPASSASKFLVTAQLIGSAQSSSNFASFRFTRNGTAIGVADADGNRVQAGSFFAWPGVDTDAQMSTGMSHLDSPSTTDDVTYKVQMSNTNHSSSTTVYLNRSQGDTEGSRARTTSVITVFEIAG